MVCFSIILHCNTPHDFHVLCTYMCIYTYWRAGASLPSRPTGAIFLFVYIYPALMYAVMFYVILNKRKLH